MSNIFNLIYLDGATGEFGKLPNSGLTNIGGTSATTFFVGGKPLLYADGTATDGSASPPSIFETTLQTSYTVSSNPANISTTASKDIQFTALNGNKFIFNADTGQVTITGDLIVNGANAGGASNIKTFEHQQSTASSIWLITHGQNSVCPTTTIYDELRTTFPQNKIMPDEITIIDANTIRVRFNSPQIGRAIFVFFD